MAHGASAVALDSPGVIPEGDRFRLINHIGDGAMGVVYELHDTRHEQSVAGKTLRVADADELYRLKKEFRAVSGLRHPNLVRLYELFVGEGHCFFTMELIAGASFLEHLRGRRTSVRTGPPDLDRCRDATRQLALGLAHLHAHGMVHRDVKPTNVLVERTGRVVVLDFGLASDLHSDASARSRAGALVGTFAYMPPEQVVGGILTPAADAYGVGMMLFEALTGELPHDDANLVDLVQRSDRVAPDPRERVPDLPADLSELTRRLLASAPEERPGMLDVVEACATSRPATTPAATTTPARTPRERLVGREDEMRHLEDALATSRREVTLVEVCGASGIGKTTLVEAFLGSDSCADAVILRSRCHPRETVPFKSVDGIVDDLVRVLTHLDDADICAVLPRHPAALLRTFPVMGRVGRLARDGDDLVPRERQEVLRQAFEALRQLLERLADQRPVVVSIDDAQWSDTDSLAVLRQVCRAPDAPRILLLLTHRSDGAAPQTEAAGEPEIRFAGLAGRHETLDLRPLDEHAVQTLADGLLAGRAPEPDALGARIVREAGGNPFLALELARDIAAGNLASLPSERASLLPHLLGQRLSRLDDAARDLVDLLAVAGHPIDETILERALGRAPRGIWDLAEDRVLRLVPLGSSLAIGLYHHALRETRLEAIEPDRLPALHEALARAFAESPGHYDDSLVDHWLAAGNPARAADCAVDLAEGAVGAGAFNRAASYYERAIELESNRCPMWLLRAKLASALLDAGRSTDAAPALLSAADELAAENPADLQQVALRRRAGGALLRSRRYHDGRDAIGDAAATLGATLPSSAAACAWDIASRRARLAMRERLGLAPSMEPVSAAENEELELWWAAGQGFAFLDPLRAAAFQARHALLAHRLGDDRHRARALSSDALFRAWRVGDRGWPRTESMLIEAERLAAAADDTVAIAQNKLARACALALNTRWQESLRLAEEGEAFCRSECRSARWELTTFQQTILMSMTMLGEYATALDRLHRYHREAQDRGDEFAKSILPIGIQNLVFLGDDDPVEAERQIHAAVGESFRERSLWHLYHGEYARGHIDLYRRDGRAALERVDRLWRRLSRGGFLRTPSIRINMRDFRARAALVLAAEAPEGSAERKTAMRRTLREVKKIRRERAVWAEPFAERLQGAAAALEGDRSTAAALLERAARGLEHQSLGVMAAGVRLRLAGVLDGERSRELRAEAEAWLRSHGVRVPDAMMPLC